MSFYTAILLFSLIYASVDVVSFYERGDAVSPDQECSQDQLIDDVAIVTCCATDFQLLTEPELDSK